MSPDPQYQQICGFVGALVLDAAAAVPYQARILHGDHVHEAVTASTAYNAALQAEFHSATMLWCPCPHVMDSTTVAADTSRPYLDIRIPNTNGETLTLYTRLFNFNKRASELVGLETMFAFARANGHLA